MNAIGNAIAGTRQLVSMGALPWFTGVAVAAFLLGASLSFVVTKRLTDGRALRAEMALSNVRAEMAEQRSATLDRARQIEADGWRVIRERDSDIMAAIDAIPGLVDKQTARRFASLREAISAPDYDCMRMPLPDDYLRGLRQPAGSAAAADHPGADLRTTAGGLLSIAPYIRADWSVGPGSD